MQVKPVQIQLDAYNERVIHSREYAMHKDAHIVNILNFILSHASRETEKAYQAQSFPLLTKEVENNL